MFNDPDGLDTFNRLFLETLNEHAKYKQETRKKIKIKLNCSMKI
jgi:hypothetical protein